jgi:hypothetical protein
MKTKISSFECFSVSLAEGWDDITATLENPDLPLTIANPNSGVGALQFSPAIYKGGALPHVTSKDLSDLLNDFAATRGMQSPFDRVTYAGDTFMVGESFHSGNDFIRVWYSSDSKNLMLVTYVCEWKQRDIEAETREMTVRSIRFM